MLRANLGGFNETTISYSNGTISIEVSNRNKLYLLKREFKSDKEVLQLTENRLHTIEELHLALSKTISVPDRKCFFVQLIDEKDELLLTTTYIIKVFTWKITLQRVVCNVKKRLELIWKRINDVNERPESENHQESSQKVKKCEELVAKVDEKFNEMNLLQSSHNETVGNEMK